MPGRLAVVEHIGSTAVTGLPAKPVIDLMAATEVLDVVTEAENVLQALGYRRIETGMPGGLLYQRAAEPVAYHLHVVTTPSWDARNERLLRDYLRVLISLGGMLAQIVTQQPQTRPGRGRSRR